MHQAPRIKTALAIFAILNLLDIASTRAALAAGLAEGNQIPSMLLAAGGEEAMYLFKIAVTLLVMAAAIRLTPYYRRLRYGLHIANLVLAFVVTINLLQLFVL
jgi:hypothetical protein